MDSESAATKQGMDVETKMRGRILDAAFAAFKAKGFQRRARSRSQHARASRSGIFTRLVLDSIGRETSRNALREIMAAAKKSGLLNGQPNRLAEQFGGPLWCDLMISLLLGVANRLGPGEIAKRASNAAAAFRRIHELPR